MQKYTAVAIGFGAGILAAWAGFSLRFNAHDLVETRIPSPTGNGYSSTFDLYRQSVYQELGLALIVFGLALLLVVFYRWLKVELTP